MKKLENDYLRVTLYLPSSSKRGKEIYKFLNSMSRYKTEFVCNLINAFLKENNVTNVELLTKREIRELIDISKEQKKRQPVSNENTENVLGMLVNLLSGNITNTNVEEKVEPEKNKDSSGRFLKKEKEEKPEPELISEPEFNSENEDNESTEELTPNWKESLQSFDMDDGFE